MFKGYTRQELERLSDLGILPSKLSISDEGDTSAPYLSEGVDIDDEGIVMRYNETGADEYPLRNRPN